ncbi:holo-ACP synthase [Falsarthrobacter nasiphocae]|uniref:Holo-[acyl-carrier-protein] synthase n=1 Tax=Falsarthrobacter nasiphocae TaxID=189863 RepID=A0AAE3YII0_9MICC|nr:holo-ACP synthase [Falsarthrobacter nasiphocae]MDR6892558.1 holo-[acyl-carrier protein] synthase [Falsarthrobacter nasiphocae]
MIRGIGIDVVNIERFAETIRRTPALVGRLFTAKESEGLTARSLAARFAAKEALAKALGAPGGLAWHDAVIEGGRGEPPVIRLTGTCADRAAQLGATRWHVSLTHDEPVAQAVVILEG